MPVVVRHPTPITAAVPVPVRSLSKPRPVAAAVQRRCKRWRAADRPECAAEFLLRLRARDPDVVVPALVRETTAVAAMLRGRAKTREQAGAHRGAAEDWALAARLSRSTTCRRQSARLYVEHLGDCDAALALLRATVADMPDDPTCWRDLSETLLACDRWDELPEVIDTAGVHLTAGTAVGLAAAAMEAGQWRWALACWQGMATTNREDLYAATVVQGQLRCFAALNVRGQVPLLPRVSRPVNGAAHMTCAYRARTANRRPRVILILGSSYSGSTLLDLVLGTLPGVADVGEAHWLVDPRRIADDNRTRLDADGYEQCWHCGPRCPILTDDLRHRLRQPDADYFGLLGEAFGANTLVVADKAYHHALRFDPGLAHDALVVFRHPLSNWRSYAAHTSRSDAASQATYFQAWHAAYAAFLDNYQPLGRTLYVDHKQFSRSPQTQLQGICAALGLPYDASALRYGAVAHHCVGGNPGLRDRLRTADPAALTIRPEPSPEQVDVVAIADAPYRDALATYDRLCKRALRA